MKRLGIITLYTLLIAVLVIFFLPKRQLYYQSESLLQSKGVVLSGEHVKDSGLALVLRGGTLYYQDLKIAELSEVKFRFLLLYNRLSVAPFTFSEAMQQFVPGTVDSLDIIYAVTVPTRIRIHARGDFGKLDGWIDLVQSKVHLTLLPSSQLSERRPPWFRELKKGPSGEYQYEVAY